MRSSVDDKSLVAGVVVTAPGFFWMAGQGGYGIQTSPAMARVAEGLIAGRGMPADLVAFGVTEAVLAPRRCRG
jgi:D-arginine dehydrogenase